MHYDIIEDLKKQCANISMYDLLQIFPMFGGSILTPIINSVTPNSQNNAAASISKNSNTPLNNELIDINDKEK